MIFQLVNQERLAISVWTVAIVLRIKTATAQLDFVQNESAVTSLNALVRTVPTDTGARLHSCVRLGGT